MNQANTSTSTNTKICILGGGFGGLYTALRLNQLPWENRKKPEIILLDQSDRFIFLPLLYELLTGEMQTWEIAPPYTEILQGTDIHFHQATVTDIDINTHTVTVQNHTNIQATTSITYDRLVLSLGGETPLELVPGAKEYAYPFRTISDVYNLEEKLRKLEKTNLEKIRIAIVGAGYSGVEIACKLADRLGEKGRFRIIETGDQILRTSSDFNREISKKALDKRGIFIDLETQVTAINENSISLEYKNQIDTIPVDLVIWTIGTKVSPVIHNLPLQKNPQGKITTNNKLQVINYPEIFALGDVADSRDIQEKPIPSTAQVAFQQADYTAWNIWASLTNRPLLPFCYQPLGEMIALGIDNATLTGLGIKLDGSLGYLARRLTYLYRLPTFNHQMKVGFNWLVQPIIQTMTKNLGYKPRP
ncbi:NAD(P)/FAD-dependent oxidoreductase [Anabaena sp. FACHB-1237]|uniref:NAD(P)/FAD-dependent oxidoreductase n=1 Tax=Anabaena sp. FACHB-1237 TaxID=2692769 RepID=UPI001680E1F4|nr:NAD(P)/FAD-dependent oxidoreductase [Anabaena sp. FACHB-1237]MBD2136112.1 NAD(P)/FAD-dependent oxidoreductase [Anabaena sp. FACHB-1237]